MFFSDAEILDVKLGRLESTYSPWPPVVKVSPQTVQVFRALLTEIGVIIKCNFVMLWPTLLVTIDYSLVDIMVGLYIEHIGLRLWGGYPSPAKHPPPAPGRMASSGSTLRRGWTWHQSPILRTVKAMGSGPKTWKLAFFPRRGGDKVCVCFVVVAIFKMGLSGWKQMFPVNQCLLSCCVNTITQMTRVFGTKLQVKENFVF